MRRSLALVSELRLDELQAEENQLTEETERLRVFDIILGVVPLSVTLGRRVAASLVPSLIERLRQLRVLLYFSVDHAAPVRLLELPDDDVENDRDILQRPQKVVDLECSSCTVVVFECEPLANAVVNLLDQV